MTFSAQIRKENIDQLSSEKMDVLIIGGGITGAGIALQAAAKGSSAGLIEMQDFAAGTSSRSTKLVHGGLRYLKQFEVELVAAIAKERENIHHNAPHIVKPDKMLLPIYDEEGASFTEFSGEVALDLYDHLAEVDDKWANELISKEKVLEKNPELREEGLVKGGLYLDYINDDARLTIEIIKKAQELGTLPVNYMEAVDYLYDDDMQIIGVKAKDEITGEEIKIHADVVVNATGHWADQTISMQKDKDSDRMYPSKGVHFVVDAEKLPVQETVYADTGLEDERMIFIIPRGNKTYFGTTDTPYDKNLIEPSISKDDVDYLLKAVNYRFPDANLTIEDIKTAWSGLRPLLLEEGATDASKISRSHEVFTSDQGLVTIAGGKLTDYRLMAEDTFEMIEKELKEKTGKTYPAGETKELALSGGDLPEGTTMSEYTEEHLEEGKAIGLSEAEARKIIEWYGTNSEKVFALKDEVKSDELPFYLELSLLYALEYESVLKPIDFLLRRTGILLFESERVDEWKKPILDYMTDYYDWSEERKEQEKKEMNEMIDYTRIENLR
ncbi:MAG: glycerol-3-phosphate dehydrogenase/oxidase [Atopostipes sp.]|nr:glycerol-3-phosphate dehydrogenase/oxidase [Atopostipes sp.]